MMRCGYVFQAHVAPDFARTSLGVWLRRHKTDGSAEIGAIQWAPYEPYSEAPPLVSYADQPQDLLQALLDAAWEAGLRPTGLNDMKEARGAINSHLQDMRALTFHLLKAGDKKP